MTIDALKFFQAYVDEMIKVGGENLPKSISTSLGTKLASIYKEKGISDFASGLKKSYEVLKGTPKIHFLSDNAIEVEVTHKENFCPIGGKYDPEKAPVFQECVCYPFTIGFLRALYPSFSFKGQVEECILNTDEKVCKYKLTWEESTH